MLSHLHPRLGHIPGGHLQHNLVLSVSARTQGGLFSSSATAAMLVYAAGTFGSHARSRLCLIGYVFFFWVICAQFRIVESDCWYDDQKYDEKSEVPTGEPCLNCTCSRSVLLCYLRVCPKLPNPPPPGCILLHRYRTCCPELICSDFYDGGNSLEARSDPEGGLDLPSDDQSAYENACISNGSIYGPGSAMHSSSLCEYCYCLTGKQICVKPKCLLPIEGCNPIFEDTSCCPVRYDCTRNLPEETSTKHATTTVISTSTVIQPKDGCLVDGNHYPEGSKVIGVGHSVCDNCYCLRSLLRCEPLSCAPPLLGCTPVVKTGECCAASYNCNGTLEIEPEPNYGLFPTISKEYSKLRKEVHRKPPTKQDKDGVVTVEPFYVLAESLQDTSTKFVYQRSPDTYGTTRHFSGGTYIPSSTQRPLTEASTTAEDKFYLISSSKQKPTTRKPVVKHRTVPGVYYATTNYEFQNANYKRVYSTTLRSHERSLPTKVHVKSSVSPPETKGDPVDSSDYLGFENLNIFSIVDSLLDGKFYSNTDNKSEIEQKPVKEILNPAETSRNPVNNIAKETTSNTFLTTDLTINSNITETTIRPGKEADATIFAMESTTKEIESTSIIEEFNTVTVLDDRNFPVTLKSVVKSTDCVNNDERISEKDNQNIDVTTVLPIDPKEVNKLAETKTEFLTTTDFDADDASSENYLTEESVSDIKLRNKEHVGMSKEDAETILNISQNKNRDDFDYDYNEPTLPPSLPNLKIIPFVAADALDSKKEAPRDPTPVFIEKKVDEEHFEYKPNLFSPPVKTEGGFVPKEPPILDTFYDNVVSVPSLTHAPSENVNINCISNGQEVQHGMSVPSESPCTTCTCFYGNIVCQKPNCPPPRSGCTEVVEQGVTLCCPNYICGKPNLSSLDKHTIHQEIVTVADGIIPSDPFRDVIRTEPAPNLQSLMGDMMSLQRITSTTPLPALKDTTTSEGSKLESTTPESEDSFGLDDVFKFIFSGGGSYTSEKSTSKSNLEKETTKNLFDISTVESAKVDESSPSSLENKNDSVLFKITSKSDSATYSIVNTTSNTKLNNSRNNINNNTENKNSFNQFNLFGTTSRRKNTSTEFNDNTVDITDKTKNTKISYHRDSNYKNQNNKNVNVVGVGLLKLAGCNIYGRMYRVGRIISELSGPCLECKCTDLGVQCRPLKC